MNWIDEANKKLQEQRDEYQEMIDSGEALHRKKKHIGKMFGKGSVESGHLKSITEPWTSEEAIDAGIKGGSKRAELAKIPGTKAQLAQQDRSERGAAVVKAKKIKRHLSILDSLPNKNITWTMIEDAAVKHDYAKREASRVVESLAIDNHLKDKLGRTRWRFCTYKKK